MKVYIGPYIHWIGPYDIADLLRYIGVHKDTRDSIGDWLSKTKINDICEWINNKKKRKIIIHIDDYDIWSMDYTLAYIILPMLKELRNTKQGAPLVDDKDVPDNLKSTSAPPKKNEWDIDKFHFDRWNYVIDEMIFAFEMKHSDWEDGYWVPVDSEVSETKHDRLANLKFDKENYTKVQTRISNGFRLFGKYYESLWD